MRILTYDIEIKRAILNGQPADEFEEQYPGIEHCHTFKDFDKMGIGCVCALVLDGPLPLIYDERNVREFQIALNDADLIVTYNGEGFDHNVLQANGVIVPITKSFDLMRVIKDASGFRFSLDAMAEKNLKIRKTDSGKLAPILWQQGHHARVINYCLNDCLMTQELYKLAKKQGYLITPKGQRVSLNFEQAQSLF